MRLRPALLTAMVLLTAACSTVPRYSAANDIHAFLVAIRDGDQATFDAHVDKPALKVQLRSRLLAETAAAQASGGRSAQNALGALGAAFAAPLVGFAVEAFVRPDVFRAQALRLGYDPQKPIPGPLAIASRVRTLGDGRACIFTKKDGPCVFDFNNEAGVWRLTGYEGPLGDLRGKAKPGA